MTTPNNELLVALAKAQLEMKPPIKDKTNPRFKTKYASIDAIYDACRVPLAKNGLTLAHSVEVLEGKMFLRTMLSHISGNSINNCFPLFMGEQTSQGFASALTYGRRYAIASLLSLPSDEDDDGEGATEAQKQAAFIGLSFADQKKIEDLIGEDKDLIARILGGYGVTKLSQIPETEGKAIINKLIRLKGVQ